MTALDRTELARALTSARDTAAKEGHRAFSVILMLEEADCILSALRETDTRPTLSPAGGDLVVHDLCGEAYQQGYRDGHEDQNLSSYLDDAAMAEGCAQWQADHRSIIQSLPPVAAPESPMAELQRLGQELDAMDAAPSDERTEEVVARVSDVCSELAKQASVLGSCTHPPTADEAAAKLGRFVGDHAYEIIHAMRGFVEHFGAIQAHLSCLPGQVDAEKVLMRLLICQGELEKIARTRSTNFATIDQLVIDNRAVLERLSASGVGHGGDTRDGFDADEFLVARVSQDTRVIGIDHPTEADWGEVLAAHVALRDRLNERIAEQEKCPLRPSALSTQQGDTQ